jgi:hypothetical protein
MDTSIFWSKLMVESSSARKQMQVGSPEDPCSTSRNGQQGLTHVPPPGNDQEARQLPSRRPPNKAPPPKKTASHAAQEPVDRRVDVAPRRLQRAHVGVAVEEPHILVWGG